MIGRADAATKMMLVEGEGAKRLLPSLKSFMWVWFQNFSETFCAGSRQCVVCLKSKRIYFGDGDCLQEGLASSSSSSSSSLSLERLVGDSSTVSGSKKG